MIWRLNCQPVPIGKSVGATASNDGESDVTSDNFSEFSGREKHRYSEPVAFVPQTDTGGRVE